MALYLGTNKVKINLDGIIRKIAVFEDIDNVLLEGIKLLSFDGYVLKDSNELYITAKDGE